MARTDPFGNILTSFELTNRQEIDSSKSGVVGTTSTEVELDSEAGWIEIINLATATVVEDPDSVAPVNDYLLYSLNDTDTPVNRIPPGGSLRRAPFTGTSVFLKANSVAALAYRILYSREAS